MFIIKKSESYIWPVVVKFPMSGGRHAEERFDAEFKRVTNSRIREIQKQIEKEEISDIDLAKEILVGWKGVHDDEKNEMPFSIENKEQLLDVALVAGAIVTAFFESITGAKRKN